MIEQAKTTIQNAQAMLIASGAGMGVDSGLPDFRGTEGFWRAYPPIAKLGLSFPETSNPIWFEQDPNFAWAFYGHRYHLYNNTNPHKGFKLLLDYAKQKPFGYFVNTSNVDGHFQKAGFEENKIYECHGTIHYLQCTEPELCKPAIWQAKNNIMPVDEKTFKPSGTLPSCIHCQRLARPNILMFNDWTWVADKTAAQQENLNQWLGHLIKNNIKFSIIEIGAGLAVPTIRHLSERIIRLTKQATLIRINPREPEVPEGHIGLALKGLEAIELLLN